MTYEWLGKWREKKQTSTKDTKTKSWASKDDPTARFYDPCLGSGAHITLIENRENINGTYISLQDTKIDFVLKRTQIETMKI